MTSPSELSKLKKKQRSITEHSSTIIDKIKNRYLLLRLKKSRIKTFIHIAKIISIILIKKLGINKHIKSEGTEKLFSIYITGGIGDAIVIARLARDLSKHLENYQFDIYFQSPQIIEPFFKKINGFRITQPSFIYEKTRKYYQFSLIANQYIYFDMKGTNLERITPFEPAVLQLYANSETVKNKHLNFIKSHPYLDGLFADIAIEHGECRYKFLHNTLGLAYTGNALPIDITADLPVELKGKKYITIHDGWDSNFPLSAARPTKAVPIKKWNEITKNIKALHPEIIIVQLGGNTGSDIENVDINLKNKINFPESTAVLSKSLLHLDAESGLVHIATALNIKCLVMFGPTNTKWFSYPENINIEPNQCGNCWWATSTWMEKCAEQYDEPICTKDISAAKIAQACVEYLNTL